MARARNIKPAFFMNDDLADISPLGRLLFIGLWTIADREGRLEDRPRRIKAEVLPYDDCDVDSLLDDLQEHDFIIRYEVDGERYVQVTNFVKHQNPHVRETESTIPAPDKHSASISTSKSSENQGDSKAKTQKAAKKTRGTSKQVGGKSVDTSSSINGGKELEESTACEDVDESTIQAQCKAQPRQERAGLIPDSLLLIPDSLEREGKRSPAKQSSRSRRATRLPEDWVLPPEWRDWALSERPDWNVEFVNRVADTFRDYWISRGGAAARKVDWLATWRNWVRREDSGPAAVGGKAQQQERFDPIEYINRNRISKQLPKMEELDVIDC